MRLPLTLLLLLHACAHRLPPGASPMVAHALRLEPGSDFKTSLLAWREAQDVEAAVIVTCVGSLTTVALRMADQPDYEVLTGPFEVVSLVGTLSPDGAHLHVAVADAAGRTIGGHLGEGSTVRTTMEVVVAVLPELSFSRRLDAVTGFPELVIRPAPVTVGP